jgi:oxygen-dependent protoporphyrinogen oxidase
VPDLLVVGGGIAGLAAAYEARRSAAALGRELDVRVVDAEARPGGKIETRREDGFLVEAGPDAFVAHKPEARELAVELGLGPRLVPSDDARGGSALLSRGRLVPLPPGLGVLLPPRLGAVLRSPVLSWGGRLRFALERWIPPRTERGDESLAELVRRRFGKETLQRLAEPILAHVHAADAERMSLESTYPRLAELERTRGSLLKAAAGAPPPKGPVFWTLKDGLGELVDALARELGPRSLALGRRALGLHPRGDGWSVHLDDGSSLFGRAVVLALPAAAATALLAEPAPDAAARLRRLRAVSIATVSLGFRAVAAEGLPGFGFFVPRREERRLLAATWSSRKFPERAPAGGLLVRAFVGGAFDVAAVDLPEDALVALVRAELAALAGITAEPVLARVFRFPAGYPQADVGHRERVAAAEAALPPGLFLAGSAFHGVGLPDCVRSGREAAARAVAATAREGSPEGAPFG